jgi:hypothetical protein
MTVAKRMLATACVAVALGISACGASGTEEIARVHGSSISEQAVAHLASVLAREHVAPGRGYQTLRRYALALLLVANWVLGEARSKGVGVSQQAAAGAVSRKARSFANGTSEYSELLRLSGRTLADAVLSEQESLATSRILSLIASRQPPITQAQISQYYHQHRTRFVENEQRQVAMVHSESKAFVEGVKREMASGPLYPHTRETESLEYAQGGHPRDEDPIYTAIYAATLGKPVGPIRVGRLYFAFTLFRIIRSRQEPLSTVAAGIGAQLDSERQTATEAAAVSTLWRTWRPLTKCRAGWVVEECRGYAGPVHAPRLDPFP